MTGQDPCTNEPDQAGAINRNAAAVPGRPTLSGHWLDLRERLALAGDVGETQLVEWLCSDQIQKWQAGQRIPAEAYLALHPAFHSESDAAFEVVYSEFMLRESMG